MTDRHLILFFWGQNDKNVELYSSNSDATLNVLKIHFKKRLSNAFYIKEKQILKCP